ncbi:MAG: ATP-dependent helicase HrpB [Chryseosolibacter sp.]
MSYPVLSVLEDVKEKLTGHRLLILEAPPGAGKSTILPLHLLDEPWLGRRKIIMLEPRRLAARSVAMRMAEIRGEEAGGTIGYRVRFENRVSKHTRVEVVTEGILTRIIQGDNALEDIGLIIFDEFHERSLQADLSLALSLQVQEVLRNDLRIMIMSATLDGQRLSELLNAPVVKSAGRQYPVNFQYVAETEKQPIATMVARAIRRALLEKEGDILAFLPGSGEIKRAAELLESENTGAILYPLYGDLNFRKQQEAILPDPQGRRKVVLATSIAETSLTIEGISVVIDSGYSRVPRFDPRSGFTRLETTRVTRDAADQRAGRAGRLGPGFCYRLWSQPSHATLVPNRNPEILDADLAPLMLELAQWGVQNISELKWVTIPPAGAVNQALELLDALGAIRGKSITERGREMLRLPTHPRIAHMLLEAKDSPENQGEALALATDVAAVLEERDPMPKGAGADLSLRIELLRRWRKGERVGAERNVLERIERLAQSWRHLFDIKADNSPVSDTQAGKWVAAAYPERIGKQTEKNGERYKMINGRNARLPEHDPLHREPWLAIAQADAGIHEGKIFLAAPVDEQDLIPLATEKEIVSWDASREMVTASLELRIGNLALSAKPQKKINEEKKLEVLCSVIRERGLALLNFGEEQRSWQARILSLRKWRPDETWPDVSDETLLKTLEEWLAPFLINLYKRSELEKLDLNTILTTLLPWDLGSRFNQLAPARLTVPSGSLIVLNYFPDGRPPVMEVRLQEVFGMLETPSVNEGKNKIVMHLLSPGYKPVQVTQDLKSFWTNTYAEVRKELKARYPKHAWPEDPWTAQAVRGAVKRRS